MWWICSPNPMRKEFLMKIRSDFVINSSTAYDRHSSRLKLLCKQRRFVYGRTSHKYLPRRALRDAQPQRILKIQQIWTLSDPSPHQTQGFTCWIVSAPLHMHFNIKFAYFNLLPASSTTKNFHEKWESARGARRGERRRVDSSSTKKMCSCLA